MRLLKNAWLKLQVDIDKALYSDDHERLEKAYQREDPFDASSAREQHRFDAINAVIRRELKPVKTALEIGSGEGRHTLRLLEVCGSVDGLESSPAALERAKRNCPKARFFLSRFPRLPKGLRKRYDLVIAAETLYFMRDLEKALAAMNRLGKFCLVTFEMDQAGCLGGLFEGIPGVLREELRYRGSEWRLYLWQSAKARRRG